MNTTTTPPPIHRPPGVLRTDGSDLYQALADYDPALLPPEALAIATATAALAQAIPKWPTRYPDALGAWGQAAAAAAIAGEPIPDPHEVTKAQALDAAKYDMRDAYHRAWTDRVHELGRVFSDAANDIVAALAPRWTEQTSEVVEQTKAALALHRRRPVRSVTTIMGDPERMAVYHAAIAALSEARTIETIRLLIARLPGHRTPATLSVRYALYSDPAALPTTGGRIPAALPDGAQDPERLRTIARGLEKSEPRMLTTAELLALYRQHEAPASGEDTSGAAWIDQPEDDQ